MANLRELQDRHDEARAGLLDLKARLDKEDRGLNEEEAKQFEKLDADVSRYEKEIKVKKKLEKHAKEKVLQDGGNKAPKKEVDHTKAFWNAMRKGIMKVSPEERKIVETRGTNVQISTTENLGGYTVPEGFAAEIIKTMKYYGGMLEACRVFQTNSGNPLPFPTRDDTANVGARIGQGVADTISDVTYGTKQLDSYTYTSKLILWAWELMNDSAFDLAAETRDIASERVGRILNTELTTSDGSSKPNGLINAASTGKTAASTSAITRAELVDTEFSVDRANRQGPNVGWMFTDKTLGEIKKLAFGSSDDRPLWQRGDITKGVPATLEGYPYWINNDFDELSDGASSNVAAFGDFSKYRIRIVQDMQLVRLEERYADQRSTGFFLYMRADGDLLDTAGVKLLTLAAS